MCTSYSTASGGVSADALRASGAEKEKRDAGFLLLNAKQRYQQFLHEFGHDSDRIPLRHVAMYIGVTDVTLSRIRREMGLT